MSNVVALPVLLPVTSALVLLAFWGRPRWEAMVSLASAALLVAVAVWLVVGTVDGQVLTLPIGSWAPRVGVVWVVDRLSALMLLLAATSSLATLIFAPASLRGAGERRWFFPLHQLLVMGVNGSFVTGDLFNLFVFFEVMLVSSFVLISLGARAEQLRQAFPYVVMNLIGSALLLGGVGVIYATAGSVNMAEVALRVRESVLPPAFFGGLALTLAVFAIKAAVVPFFFWLPDSYPLAPLPVSAFFAGLLTKVGVYTLFRAFTLFTGEGDAVAHDMLLVLSVATMALGVLGALGRNSVRAILSFHIVSQVGYMVFGLALFTPMGVAAGLFYVVHHILVKTALFLAGGAVEAITGSGDLAASRGLARAHPIVGLAFFVPAMALAGIPPLSGFWGKLFLLMAGFGRGAHFATGIAVIVGLLTLASMLKIWFSVFWGAPGAGEDHPPPAPPSLVAPPLGLAALSVLVGLASPWIWRHAERTAQDLLSPNAYLSEVMKLSEPSSGWRGAKEIQR
jgi:multicomponent Na+:H+ antiporter subunit D